MDNNKLPAHPYRSNALEGGHTDPGITKAEYFAATAPDDIPDWFTHSMDEIGPRPSVSEPPYSHFSDNVLYTKEWDSENRDWYTEESKHTDEHRRLKPIIISYYEQWSNANKARKEWELANTVERYFQWRQYYGMKMAELFTPKAVFEEANKYPIKNKTS